MSNFLSNDYSGELRSTTSQLRLGLLDSSVFVTCTRVQIIWLPSQTFLDHFLRAPRNFEMVKKRFLDVVSTWIDVSRLAGGYRGVVGKITKDWRHFDMFAKEKEIIASGEKSLKVLKTEDLKGMQSLASVKNGNETVAPVAATEKSYRSLYLWDLLELWCVSFFFLFRIFCFLIFSPKTGKVTVSFSSYIWIRRTRSDDCIKKTAIFIGNLVEVCVAVMGLEI